MVTLIDCDAHVFPRDSMDYLPPELAHLKPQFEYDEHGHLARTTYPEGWPSDGWAHLPGTTPNNRPGGGSGGKMDGMYDVEVRVQDLITLGIARQVLLPQFGGWGWSGLIEPKLAAAMARSHNLSVLSILKRHPERFFGGALIALQDVPSAIAEITWAHENGFSAVVVDETYAVEDHPFGEALGCVDHIWPIFEAAERLDMPIFLHRVQHGHRIANAVKFRKAGLDFMAPDDGQMTVVSLITSGLLDSYPGLKFIHTETSTGWLRPMVELMDALFAGSPPRSYADLGAQMLNRRTPPVATGLPPAEVTSAKNKLAPSSYFKENLWFTIETEERDLVDSVRFLGADRFLFATDYPHDDPGGQMKDKDAELFEANSGLTSDEKELIGHTNAELLFRL